MTTPPKYLIVHQCPVPRKLAPILRQLLTDSHATLESCYRGSDAEWLLHKYGKKSQAELYAGYIAHRPGYNPANPPGYSTHELRSDGVAYPKKKRGAPLVWWQVGMDIDDAHIESFIRAAKKRGYSVTITYPSSISEHHHLNFRYRPSPLVSKLKKLVKIKVK